MTEIYSFIKGEEGRYAIVKMCEWADVSTSGYYSWKFRKPSTRARRHELLKEQISAHFTASDSTYGYRRIHAALVRSGVSAHPETVRKQMRSLNLLPCQTHFQRPKTTRADGSEPAPDLVNRDFTADRPGMKLVGDITYVKTWEGWSYLATVLDCFSKKVVGHAIADNMAAELVADALEMASRNIVFTPKETIFHTDRGSQYTSRHFADTCEKHGVLQSMGKTGICYDNAWAESFNGTLKVERVHRTEYPTIEHARKDITRYIELFYNHKRLHSALDYQTPNEVESRWLKENKAA